MHRVEYTEKIHAQRTLRMLLYRTKIYDNCPAAPKYKVFQNGTFKAWKNNPCLVCQNFIGLHYQNNCPCRYYGYAKALTLTMEQLMERSYVTGAIARKNLFNRVYYLIKLVRF